MTAWRHHGQSNPDLSHDEFFIDILVDLPSTVKTGLPFYVVGRIISPRKGTYGPKFLENGIYHLKARVVLFTAEGVVLEGPEYVSQPLTERCCTKMHAYDLKYAEDFRIRRICKANSMKYMAFRDLKRANLMDRRSKKKDLEGKDEDQASQVVRTGDREYIALKLCFFEPGEWNIRFEITWGRRGHWFAAWFIRKITILADGQGQWLTEEEKEFVNDLVPDAFPPLEQDPVSVLAGQMLRDMPL
ncbi:hypothetical protein ANO14919_110700 [Xylariales sp. No.14919]|nr:hypothetical protein ANO14919_110700 [Xylariales sp. No.14919]